MELVEASVQRSLLEEKGNPQKSYTSLARILRTTGVDKILEHFPADRRQELTSLSPRPTGRRIHRRHGAPSGRNETQGRGRLFAEDRD